MDHTNPPNLFIPGPTQVAPEILDAMSAPAVGHRTPECADLWRTARQGLGRLMQTRAEVLMLTAPASAMMEASIRNGVRERCLNLICGAFSKRWHDVSVSCGKDAVPVEVEWGKGFSAEELRTALEAHAPVDAVTVVHNETSTGVVNPIQDYAAVLADFPGTFLFVDTVSSMGGIPVEVDAWGLDVCLFGVQKCLALPAGIAVASASDATLARAAEIEYRGWFLDFLRLQKSNAKEQSPTTPSTAHLYALVRQLERIFEEGLQARWDRHRAMAECVRTWAEGHGWNLFSAEGFRSNTVSCIARGEGPDFLPALDTLREQGILVSNGYGALKDKTFRIGHMGEHDLAAIQDLLCRFDAALTSNGISA